MVVALSVPIGPGDPPLEPFVDSFSCTAGESSHLVSSFALWLAEEAKGLVYAGVGSLGQEVNEEWAHMDQSEVEMTLHEWIKVV